MGNNELLAELGKNAVLNMMVYKVYPTTHSTAGRLASDSWVTI